MDKTIAVKESFHQLRQQTIILLPIRPSDKKIENELIKCLPQPTKHYRFLASTRQVSAQQLKALCDVCFDQSKVFIALRMDKNKQTEIGFARYSPTTIDGASEIAITVIDDWQNVELVTFLTQKLISIAKDRGIKELFSIDTLGLTNMAHLAIELGMSKKRDPDDAYKVIYSLKL